MDFSKALFIFILLIALFAIILPIQRLTSRVYLPPHFAEELFKNFTQKFNKSYNGPDEYQKRLNNFKIALEDIATKNMAENATAKYGITQYSDLSPDEFLLQNLHQNLTRYVHEGLSIAKSGKMLETPIEILTNELKETIPLTNDGDKIRSFYSPALLRKNLNFIPIKVDWRSENVLNPVRRQGKCGACWAYSVMSMLEANAAIHKSIKTSLSIQEAIDCAKNGNTGCKGGDTCLLLQWLEESKAPLLTSDEYPLSDNDDQLLCQMNKVQSTGTAKIAKDFKVIDYSCESFVNNEKKLLEVIANYGPVTAAVNALNWQHYLSGIIQGDCDGGVDKINHAVQIVGFDQSGNVPYYIVQNSWGSTFGENGFIRIAYGQNVCGIANQISMAKLS